MSAVGSVLYFLYLAVIPPLAARGWWGSIYGQTLQPVLRDGEQVLHRTTSRRPFTFLFFLWSRGVHLLDLKELSSTKYRVGSHDQTKPAHTPWLVEVGFMGSYGCAERGTYKVLCSLYEIGSRVFRLLLECPNSLRVVKQSPRFTSVQKDQYQEGLAEVAYPTISVDIIFRHHRVCNWEPISLG